MSKPVITIIATMIKRILGETNTIESANVGDRYISSVERAGGMPIIVPIMNDYEMIDKYLDMSDGLLFTGGYDINPMVYDEEPHENLHKYWTRIDLFQIEFMKRALERDIPILGVCRGHQILNIVQGGTLYQDMSEIKDVNKRVQHIQRALGKGETVHKIKVIGNTKLHSVLGNEHYVNSYHHQFIKDLGKDLKVTARTKDGVIEAIEMEGKEFVMGVQWHPEINSFCDDKMLDLFKMLIDKSRKQ